MREDTYPSNQLASDPVNALLNYLYRVGETEAVHACHATGLIPSIGISHTDKPGRDSMALDLMEAIRPACDRVALSMLAPDGAISYTREGKPRYFDRRWVSETREGACRLIPPVTHELASHAGTLAAAILPVTLQVAQAIADTNRTSRRMTASLRGRRVPGQAKATPMAPRAWLKPGVTTEQLVPDEVWARIAPLLPPRPASRVGRPQTSSDREIIGGLAARYILGVPWSQCPAPPVSMRQRLNKWQQAGCWTAIRSELESAGHLSELAELI